MHHLAGRSCQTRAVGDLADTGCSQWLKQNNEGQQGVSVLASYDHDAAKKAHFAMLTNTTSSEGQDCSALQKLPCCHSRLHQQGTEHRSTGYRKRQAKKRKQGTWQSWQHGGPTTKVLPPSAACLSKAGNLSIREHTTTMQSVLAS